MYRLIISNKDEKIVDQRHKSKSAAILQGNTIRTSFMANALGRSYADYFALDQDLKMVVEEIGHES